MSEKLPEVGLSAAASMVEKGGFLLDVREADEWDAGRAPVSVHIPLSELTGLVSDAHSHSHATSRDGRLGAPVGGLEDPDENRLSVIPADRQILVICRSGVRSAHATGLLRHVGRDATNVAGGMLAWEAAGLPVERDGGLPGVVV